MVTADLGAEQAELVKASAAAHEQVGHFETVSVEQSVDGAPG